MTTLGIGVRTCGRNSYSGAIIDIAAVLFDDGTIKAEFEQICYSDWAGYLPAALRASGISIEWLSEHGIMPIEAIERLSSWHQEYCPTAPAYLSGAGTVSAEDLWGFVLGTASKAIFPLPDAYPVTLLAGIAKSLRAEMPTRTNETALATHFGVEPLDAYHSARERAIYSATMSWQILDAIRERAGITKQSVATSNPDQPQLI